MPNLIAFIAATTGYCLLKRLHLQHFYFQQVSTRMQSMQWQIPVLLLCDMVGVLFVSLVVSVTNVVCWSHAINKTLVFIPN